MSTPATFHLDGPIDVSGAGTFDHIEVTNGATLDGAVIAKSTVDLKGAVTAEGPVTLPDAIPTPAVGAWAAVGAAAGNVDVGAHDYLLVALGGNGKTLGSAHIQVTIASSAKHVTHTAIPLGGPGTTSRELYRSKAGTISPLFLAHTFADNTTTTYDDNLADSGLPGTQPPSVNNTGPVLTVANKALLGGGIGKFGHAAPTSQTIFTESLSTVADAPAKALLTKIIAILVGDGSAIDSTT